MARRTLFWHLGLARAAREVLPANLEAHRERLGAVGLAVVASPEEARLATHELLRTHREAGLRRGDLEGRWARLCDRVWAHKGVSLLSTPDLCEADKDQLALALDPLIGVEVHLVVTVDPLAHQLYGGWLAELRRGRTTSWDTYVERVLAAPGEATHRQVARFWAGHELGEVLGRWAWTIRPERVHVIAGGDPARQWGEYADLAGVRGESARLCVVPPHAGPAGVAVLRRVNRRLEEPLAPGSDRVLLEADVTGASMPSVDTTALRPLVEGWAQACAAAGHDVRGDLAGLAGPAGEGTEVGLPRPGDQLGVAVDALADALAENDGLRRRVASLEADNERLDRKRRKHRRAARALAAGR